jgi:hypothetical protein
VFSQAEFHVLEVTVSDQIAPVSVSDGSTVLHSRDARFSQGFKARHYHSGLSRGHYGVGYRGGQGRQGSSAHGQGKEELFVHAHSMAHTGAARKGQCDSLASGARAGSVVRAYYSNEVGGLDTVNEDGVILFVGVSVGHPVDQ